MNNTATKGSSGTRAPARKVKGSLWTASKPRPYTPEESKTRQHAMLGLAHRVAKQVRDGAIRPSNEAMRIAINNSLKESADLRLLGYSPADASRILNATRALLQG